MSVVLFNPPPELIPEVIDHLCSPDSSLASTARAFKTSLHAFSAWMTRPDIEQQITLRSRAFAMQAHLAVGGILPSIVKALAAIVSDSAARTDQSHEDHPREIDPSREAERTRRRHETTRKACALLLRIGTYTPGFRRPRPLPAPPRSAPPQHQPQPQPQPQHTRPLPHAPGHVIDRKVSEAAPAANPAAADPQHDSPPDYSHDYSPHSQPDSQSDSPPDPQPDGQPNHSPDPRPAADTDDNFVAPPFVDPTDDEFEQDNTEKLSRPAAPVDPADDDFEYDPYPDVICPTAFPAPPPRDESG